MSIRAGQAAARAQGKRWRGSKAGRYVKVRPDQMQAIMDLVGWGEKITGAARITGLSRLMIYRVVRNERRGPREAQPPARSPKRASRSAGAAKPQHCHRR